MPARLIAAGVLVALVAAVAWQWHADAVEASEHTLTPLDAAAVRHVSVELRGLPPQHFEREGGHWTTQGKPTDEGRAEELTELASTPVADWKPAADYAPSKVGLDPPVAVLTLDDTRIEFGDMTAVGKQRYARVGDRMAFVPAQALPRAPRTASIPTSSSSATAPTAIEAPVR